jgi:hypothetical protein
MTTATKRQSERSAKNLARGNHFWKPALDDENESLPSSGAGWGSVRSPLSLVSRETNYLDRWVASIIRIGQPYNTPSSKEETLWPYM